MNEKTKIMQLLLAKESEILNKGMFDIHEIPIPDENELNQIINIANVHVFIDGDRKNLEDLIDRTLPECKLKNDPLRMNILWEALKGDFSEKLGITEKDAVFLKLFIIYHTYLSVVLMDIEKNGLMVEELLDVSGNDEQTKAFKCLLRDVLFAAKTMGMVYMLACCNQDDHVRIGAKMSKQGKELRLSPKNQAKIDERKRKANELKSKYVHDWMEFKKNRPNGTISQFAMAKGKGYPNGYSSKMIKRDLKKWVSQFKIR